MANPPSSILPIDIGPRPEARPKPGPVRSEDPARFQRHLDNTPRERSQRPERPSVSHRQDIRQDIRQEERQTTRRHGETEPARAPARSERLDQDRARPASKPDRTDLDPDHRADPPPGEPSPVQGRQSQIPGAESETPQTEPAAGQPAIQPAPVPSEHGPEIPTAATGLNTVQADSDLPGLTPKTTAADPAGDAALRPALPEPEHDDLRNAALDIPEHYSGQGRPADPGLIQDAPAVPDDEPLALILTQEGAQTAEPNTADPTGIIAAPEDGEPLAFEAPQADAVPIAATDDEIVPGLARAVTLAPAPEADQPIAVSNTAPIPDVPRTEATSNPAVAKPLEGPQPSAVAPAAHDTNATPAKIPQPAPPTQQPVAEVQIQNAAPGSAPSQAGVALPGSGDTVKNASETPVRPPNPGPPVQAAPAQQTKPQETARPVETPVSPAPAPQAVRGSLARPDTGLLSQLADTGPATGTPEPRPSLILSDEGTAQPASSFDKAAINAAAASPQRTTGLTPTATPATPPPLLAGGAVPVDAPVSVQAAAEAQPAVPLQAQSGHNVSIRFGTSPQLGANAQTPVNTLAFNIAKNFDNGVTRFQVRIDPPELGRVDVKLDMTVEGRVRAHLTVERSETLELMMRDARSLEKALADTGLSLHKESLSFSLKDQNAFTRQDDGSGPEATNTAVPDDPDEPLPEQMTRGYISDSGVDITV